LADLFRQSAYSRLAGYEDLNDYTSTEGTRAALKTAGALAKEKQCTQQSFYYSF
jgi:hypothetical protein